MQKPRYQSERGVLSNRWNAYDLVLEGIASEFAAAKGFGCDFDPFVRSGGDGFVADLWRGDLTIALKIRHKTYQQWFIQPRNDPHTEFPDDFGVLGYKKADNCYDFPFYFDRATWNQHWQWRTLPSGLKQRYDSGLRRTLTEEFLRASWELDAYLEQIDTEPYPHEALSTVESIGCFWSERNRLRGRGNTME